MIYYNNQFTQDTHCVSAQDRGLLLADGLFETIYCHHSTPIALKEHWQRLQNGLQHLSIRIELSYQELEKIIDKLLQKNNLTQTTASVRVTITRGAGQRGLTIQSNQQPTLLITATEYNPNNKPISLHISQYTRNEHSPLSNLKTLNYLDNILARNEAQQHGYDDALMLNTKGEIACTSAANFFAIIDDILITPSIECGILPGITRQRILDIAQQANIPFKQHPIKKTQISDIQAAFICNSLISIQMVNKINEHTLPTEHTVAQEIQRTYQNTISPLKKS